MSVTFEVCDVKQADEPLEEVPYLSAAEQMLGGPVEACSEPESRIVSAGTWNGFAATVHHAFNDHRPLALSPDDVWLLLCQGLANHVSANAETLRGRFVSHEGQAKIEIRRDDFVKGSAANPWPDVFEAFSQRIREQSAGVYDLIAANFTTTGPVERAAFEVTLMDTMKSYFDYSFVTLCGIPAITLEGAPSDWGAIRERVEAFRAYGLDSWVDALTPILNQFGRAMRGKIDRDFWGRIYKLAHESGGPYITGWIIKLFPYIERNSTLERNPYIEKDPDDGPFSGLKTHSFPPGLSKAPFVWKYLGQEFNMQFLAGFTGAIQDHETRTLRPAIGWMVVDTDEFTDEVEVRNQQAQAEKERRLEEIRRARPPAETPKTEPPATGDETESSD